MNVDFGQILEILKENNKLLHELSDTVNEKINFDNDKYMTIKEAAEYTRYSESTIRRYIRSREITHAQRANNIIIKKSWLDDWLERSIVGL